MYKRQAKSAVKTMGLTCRLQLKLVFLSEVEVGGIPSVAVKCVDTVSYTHLDVYKRQDIQSIAFAGCKKLTSIEVDSNNENYS